jgi:hypothetical protein
LDLSACVENKFLNLLPTDNPEGSLELELDFELLLVLIIEVAFSMSRLYMMVYRLYISSQTHGVLLMLCVCFLSFFLIVVSKYKLIGN